jgi:rhamnose utilization protein RhaD (predicted bifunctional aldolase and dehydrogenase)
MDPQSGLVELARSLGVPERGLAILAEGNVSCRDGDAFWVKASGRRLADLDGSGLTRCGREALARAAGSSEELSDEAVADLLQGSVLEGPRPSVEAFFHAWLLGLPGVAWVGHVHPVHALALLCTEDGQTMCSQRLFPDEVVLCGPATCWVPYVDPGLPLAQAMAAAVRRFEAGRGALPRLVALQNHGIVALGSGPGEVEAALLMAEKAARVACLARAGRVPLTWLSAGQVARIAGRPDEHYRQAMLWPGASTEPLP